MKALAAILILAALGGCVSVGPPLASEDDLLDVALYCDQLQRMTVFSMQYDEAVTVGADGDSLTAAAKMFLDANPDLGERSQVVWDALLDASDSNVAMYQGKGWTADQVSLPTVKSAQRALCERSVMARLFSS